MLFSISRHPRIARFLRNTFNLKDNNENKQEKKKKKNFCRQNIYSKRNITATSEKKLFFIISEIRNCIIFRILLKKRVLKKR